MADKACLHCSAVIPSERRWALVFCNNSCSAKYSNARRRSRAVRCACAYCGASCKRRGGKFCSIKCQRAMEFDERYKQWMDGALNDSWIGYKTLGKFIARRDGYQCSECSVSEWNGKPLTLQNEHKNGNGVDHSPSNVCLICPNCHSQTSTFAGRNRGNGRLVRRLRDRADAERVRNAAIAQTVERRFRKPLVEGAIPSGSSTLLKSYQ